MTQRWCAAPPCGRWRNLRRTASPRSRTSVSARLTRPSARNGQRRPAEPMLLCFGFGYCAQHFAAELGQKFGRVIGTARNPQKGPVENLPFDGTAASDALRAAIAE